MLFNAPQILMNIINHIGIQILGVQIKGMNLMYFFNNILVVVVLFFQEAHGLLSFVFVQWY